MQGWGLGCRVPQAEGRGSFYFQTLTQVWRRTLLTGPGRLQQAKLWLSTCPPHAPSPQLRAGPWDVGACSQRSQAQALTGVGGLSHLRVTCSGKAARRKRPQWEAGGMRLPQDSGQHLAGRGPGPRHPVHSQDPPRSHVTGVWVQARERHPRAECVRGFTRMRPCLALLAFAVAVVRPHQDEWSWQGQPGCKAQQLWGQPCAGVCGSAGAPLGISRVLAGSRRLTPTKDRRKGP